MKNPRNLLGEPAFHIFLFVAGLVLLTWPFLAVFYREGLRSAYADLFVAWVVAIVLLFFIGRCCRNWNSNGNDGARSEKRSND